MTYNGSLMYAAAMPPCCEGESAHVVTISNEAETEFLTTILPEADQTVWIGLDDKDGDGQYAWVKGEALTYRQAAVLEYPAGLCASYKEVQGGRLVSCELPRNLHRSVRVRLCIRIGAFAVLDIDAKETLQNALHTLSLLRSQVLASGRMSYSRT